MVYMGAIASGGTAALPYLVESARSGGKETYRVTRSRTAPMLSREAAEILRSYMRRNVEKVYGAVQIPGLEICAKSGTAEVGADANTATFAGFIDSEDYPLAFIVVVEQGGSGSRTCAPIARAVLEACINVLDAE